MLLSGAAGLLVLGGGPAAFAFSLHPTFPRRTIAEV
jgi:hypothetical protein